MNKNLILYIPVIHQGYVDLFQKYKDKVKQIYLIPRKLVKEFSQFEPDIASLDSKQVKIWLKSFGFSKVTLFRLALVIDLQKENLMMINDQVSRTLKNKYFSQNNVEWINVFLRWDREKVLAEESSEFVISKNKQDKAYIDLAYSQANNSSDWWRQVGAVLVKKGKVIAEVYNQGIPNDHSPYQQGAIRDFMRVGEKPERANYIHAEQKLISQAAKKGQSLNGSALYLTHFPCAVCAKLIAFAGIKELFFAEGSSNLDGLDVLKRAGVIIKQVK